MDAVEIPEKRRAPDGMIWRCAACGKEAEDLYGMIGARSQGWDESCMLNALQLCRSLVETARRAERETADELIRLKERLDARRQHRMELEELADTLAKDQPKETAP